MGNSFEDQNLTTTVIGVCLSFANLTARLRRPIGSSSLVQLPSGFQRLRGLPKLILTAISHRATRL